MRLTYLAVLLGAFLGAGWLEVVLHTGVFRRWRRLLLTLAPVLVVFVLWDLYAISRGQWTFDPHRTTGLRLGRMPLEELLFFVVIPICSVLTLEAVRVVRGWPVGDEPSDRSGERP